MVAEIRRKVLALLRDAGIACIYSVSLGCLFAARQFWIDQTPNRGPRLPRLRATAEAVLRTSPYIILTGMLFAFLAIPLAAWAIGSASWGSLRRYIYVLWSVLALYIITCESADGLILISGAGLIALWLLRNAGLSIRSRTNLSTNMPLRIGSCRREVTVFAALAVFVGILSIFLFYGSGSNRYLSEILAIYIVACICQVVKAFRLTEQARSANREVKGI